MSEHRNWCFTLNNYTENDIKEFTSLKKCEYIFQEETGENGTKHLQGYIGFKSARNMNRMKKLNGRAHWEVCRDKKASIIYCSKEETRSGNIYSNFNYNEYLFKDRPKLIRQKAYCVDRISDEEKKTLQEDFIQRFIHNELVIQDGVPSRPGIDVSSDREEEDNEPRYADIEPDWNEEW